MSLIDLHVTSQSLCFRAKTKMAE